MEDIWRFWWVALGLLAFPMAWCSGYLSSIRSEHWKRYYGHALCLIALVCLIAANVFSPKAPTGFSLVALTAWTVVYGSVVIVFLVGWAERRKKSKFQGKIIL